jgi:hypothetical protein
VAGAEAEARLEYIMHPALSKQPRNVHVPWTEDLGLTLVSLGRSPIR